MTIRLAQKFNVTTISPLTIGPTGFPLSLTITKKW